MLTVFERRPLGSGGGTRNQTTAASGPVLGRRWTAGGSGGGSGQMQQQQLASSLAQPIAHAVLRIRVSVVCACQPAGGAAGGGVRSTQPS